MGWSTVLNLSSPSFEEQKTKKCKQIFINGLKYLSNKVQWKLIEKQPEGSATLKIGIQIKPQGFTGSLNGLIEAHKGSSGLKMAHRSSLGLTKNCRGLLGLTRNGRGSLRLILYLLKNELLKIFSAQKAY